MTRVQWMFIGATAGAVGALAVALTLAPATPNSAPAIAAAPASVPVSVVAAPVAPVVAAAPVARKARPATRPTSFAPAEAGMMIAIDPETGETGMPSAEQLAEMKVNEADAVSRDFAGTPTYYPNGMISVDLNGRMQDYAVVRPGKDGKPVVGCVQHPGDLEHLHLTPAGLEEE